ncbi:divalent-cation tolerance protein CutA [Herminiimonas arsenitoxidans]|uniref:divalent-cation tolerance protein CutA n=1 Tax=Herminiimonas arsenitoxidans TaxID=1809410 RepID=UPI00097052EF|nr:divalent-cation tolerance protein CutA [Herminiimonas arsenitoxidans]
MSITGQVLLVCSNVPNIESAKKLAQHLLEQRLAACVNILPAVQSMYRWQGVIEEASEVTLHIKTTQARYTELEAAIKAAHPYDVPEIIAVPVVEGLSVYLDWVRQETNKDSDV